VECHTYEKHKIKCPTNKNDFTVISWVFVEQSNQWLRHCGWHFELLPLWTWDNSLKVIPSSLGPQFDCSTNTYTILSLLLYQGGQSIKNSSIHLRPPHLAQTSSPARQWRHKPEMLIKGCCNYTAQVGWGCKLTGTWWVYPHDYQNLVSWFKDSDIHFVVIKTYFYNPSEDV